MIEKRSIIFSPLVDVDAAPRLIVIPIIDNSLECRVNY